MELEQRGLPTQLADAAIKIATANHYLIGFDPDTCRDVSFDDLSEAKQELITRESALPVEDGTSANRAKRRRIDLAFRVLDTLCYRVHGMHL